MKLNLQKIIIQFHLNHYFIIFTLEYMIIWWILKNQLETLLVEELFDLKKEHHGKLLEHCQYILDDCIEVKDCLILLNIAYKWNQEELMDKMIQMAADNYKQIEQDPLFKTINSNLIQTKYLELRDYKIMY